MWRRSEIGLADILVMQHRNLQSLDIWVWTLLAVAVAVCFQNGISCHSGGRCCYRYLWLVWQRQQHLLCGYCVFVAFPLCTLNAFTSFQLWGHDLLVYHGFHTNCGVSLLQYIACRSPHLVSTIFRTQWHHYPSTPGNSISILNAWVAYSHSLS